MSKLITEIKLLGLVRSLRKRLPPKKINYWLLPSVILLKETNMSTALIPLR